MKIYYNTPVKSKQGSSWGKKLLVVLMLLLTSTTLFAQNFTRRGFALGADRDSLLYIIASPFDNWYIGVSGTMQTFIGNELVASARMNKLNYGGRLEIGKWIIPDLAVSGRFSLFNVDGQTRYGLQPFVDMTSDVANDNGYYPFHAYAASFMGYVTLDWTNFLRGYERGKRTRTHIYTPVGLGMSMLFGSHRNPRNADQVGSMRRNWELAFSVGLGVEYEFSQDFSMNVLFDYFMSKSSWDWSPYDNAYSIFDVIPSISVGAKFNLIKSVTKYNHYTKESKRVEVYHEFQTVGSPSQLVYREEELQRLSKVQDSLINLMVTNNNNRDDLLRQYDSLADIIDAINQAKKRDTYFDNMLAELLDYNESQGLPAVVVFFQLDRYELDYNANKRLQSFAREINRLPDTLQFYLFGAADSATGSISHNIWLSEQRCNVVYKKLVDEYGVNGDRLVITPLGGITDYTPQENNRMGMLILRNHDTEEIVNRWQKTGSTGIGDVNTRDHVPVEPAEDE